MEGGQKPRYDLRSWKGNTPLKGITLERDDLSNLHDAIACELEKDKSKSVNESDVVLPFGIDDKGNEDETRVLDYRNVIVHDNFDECIMEGHDFGDVDAIVPIYKTSGVVDVKIKARHCKTCAAYYISNQTYLDLKRNGAILCKVVSKKEYNEFIKNTNFGDLDFQFILAITGYNTNAKNNLTDSCRQAILTRAINDGIYTKQKAINHIGFLINLNEDKVNMSVPVSKWRRDREFLTGVKENNSVKVKRILK